jgi:hypothetical protein
LRVQGGWLRAGRRHVRLGELRLCVGSGWSGDALKAVARIDAAENTGSRLTYLLTERGIL